MKEIIAAVGAAVFFVKGINAMTDKAIEKCRSFRLFRDIFWGVLAVVALSVAVVSVSWALKQVFIMWTN